MREILLIGRAWLWGVKNTFLRKGEGRKRRGGWLGLTAIFGVAYLVFYGVSHFLAFVQGNLRGLPDPAGAWRILNLNLANGLALTSFIFLFMTALGTVMANFLEGRSLEFLLAQPFRIEAVFAAKFVESLLSMMMSLVPMVLPCWLALGMANRAGAGFYLMVVLSFIGGGVLFLGPVTILLLLVMRYITRQRVRQAVISLSLLAGLAFVFGTQLLNAIAARTGLGGQVWLARLGAWSITRTFYLPHAWMAGAPMATLGWPGLSLAATALPLILTSTVVYLAALSLARRIFLAGWSSAQESAERVPRASFAHSARGRRTFPGGPFFGLLRKDFALVGREPLLWYNLAVSIIVVGFFVWNTTSLGGHGGRPPLWLGTFYAVMIAFSTVGWNSQIGGISISREGSNWWLLQVSPGRAEHIFAAKFVFAFLPQLAFIVLANLALWAIRSMPGFSFWSSVAIGLAVAAGITGLSLLLDALAPNFQLKLDGKWSGGKNVGAGKVTLTTLLGLFVVILMGISLALPGYYELLPFADRLSPASAGVVGTALFAAETLAALGVSWWVGVARLKKLIVET